MAHTDDPLVPGPSRPRHGHRLLAALACLVMVLLSSVAVQGTTVARADDDDTPRSWSIPEYNLDANVNRDGDAQVTLDMAFDFDNDKGHGPYLTFVKKQRLTDDPDHWRMIDYSKFAVTSPSGANANVEVNDSSSAVQLKIGRKGSTYTGIQRYRVTFTVHGLIAPKSASSGLDEFNWRVFDNFDVPIDQANVKITGPAAVQRTACFQETPCTSSKQGSTATFQGRDFAKRDPFQVVAGFPAGTFSEKAVARETKRYHAGNTFGLDPATAVGTVLTALLAGWVAVRSRLKGRDREFAGVAPGIIPPNGEGPVQVRRKDPEVAVAFQPPRDVSPAEAGTLLDGSADTEDVTAAMLDLAVRGHLTISPMGADRKGRTKDWSFTQTPQSGDTLRSWERTYLDMFFDGSRNVTTAQLRDQHDNNTLSVATGNLNTAVKTYGWYDTDPMTLRMKSLGAGLGIALLGVVIAVAGAFVGWGLLGVPVLLIGIVMGVAGMMRSPGRTAKGTAVLDQIKGFRLYLTTAEADQIKFEEGIDVFSRYLPWATVFGVADRWVKIFQDLEARGIYHGNYGWYGGDSMAFNAGFAYGFSSSLNDMNAAMASSMEAAGTSSTSSSGGGFSGGGGFGGGGGGGW
ncbi:DUF2207 domain-containing protein [Acidipropionibacterium jensenii]|uniref:DUF2207 domain-containing protein n=1 Tax=Acidipropionibacterium jensenii TaxID=1749 RepID=A0A3Q9UK35_9ACTN|nr:DUF2207 domain-containing protein [Acidipropionibacterium jensenii]AZZ39002.1 DUF2207 domain-containing protein [Acidipropionibacterium jensenii]MDN5977189.1 DUF2207 domain-containing protein [Acidipropionibacterium jensenii]MDN5996057.1 DUF2207 domain-containing protein [Acidipropionibacterium jensenii]MDN6426380.1 DUF2207 domain-containing protein [Acidipropionibacterium jensenii]MDN6442359.1 DUF2207 domain-containing protein [Acidipropionibacterium jensenii]